MIVKDQESLFFSEPEPVTLKFSPDLQGTQERQALQKE